MSFSAARFWPSAGSGFVMTRSESGVLTAAVVAGVSPVVDRWQHQAGVAGHSCSVISMLQDASDDAIQGHARAMNYALDTHMLSCSMKSMQAVYKHPFYCQAWLGTFALAKVR